METVDAITIMFKVDQAIQAQAPLLVSLIKFINCCIKIGFAN